MLQPRVCCECNFWNVDANDMAIMIFNGLKLLLQHLHPGTVRFIHFPCHFPTLARFSGTLLLDISNMKLQMIRMRFEATSVESQQVANCLTHIYVSVCLRLKRLKFKSYIDDLYALCKMCRMHGNQNCSHYTAKVCAKCESKIKKKCRSDISFATWSEFRSRKKKC